jgi:hypothetical protein
VGCRLQVATSATVTIERLHGVDDHLDALERLAIGAHVRQQLDYPTAWKIVAFCLAARDETPEERWTHWQQLLRDVPILAEPPWAPTVAALDEALRRSRLPR